jgi:hypothetical protein
MNGKGGGSGEARIADGRGVIRNTWGRINTTKNARASLHTERKYESTLEMESIQK